MILSNYILTPKASTPIRHDLGLNALRVGVNFYYYG